MINLIVAMDESGGIARQGRIPNIPTDMKKFAEITKKSFQKNKLNLLIVGKRTFDITPPLRRRLTYVIMDRNPNIKHEIDKALELNGKHNIDQIFIIGGAKIYNAAMEQGVPDVLFLTRIVGNNYSDTITNIPQYLNEEFQMLHKTTPIIENNNTYRFEIHVRKSYFTSFMDAIMMKYSVDKAERNKRQLEHDGMQADLLVLKEKYSNLFKQIQIYNDRFSKAKEYIEQLEARLDVSPNSANNVLDEKIINDLDFISENNYFQLHEEHAQFSEENRGLKYDNEVLERENKRLKLELDSATARIENMRDQIYDILKEDERINQLSKLTDDY